MNNYCISCSQAVGVVHQIRKSSENLKKQEAVIRRGLNIFKIDQSPNKDVITLDENLESLETIWELYAQWNELYNGWKVGMFKNLVTDEMELTAQQMLKKITKTVREIKVKNHLSLLIAITFLPTVSS